MNEQQITDLIKDFIILVDGDLNSQEEWIIEIIGNAATLTNSHQLFLQLPNGFAKVLIQNALTAHFNVYGYQVNDISGNYHPKFISLRRI